MSLPTAIERLNAHLIGFVRAYTFQLARRIEPQLPTGSEGGADALGHQAALQAARAIVNTARDKLDVRRMLSALEKHLAGMGRDDSEPFGRLLAELGDPRYSATSHTAPTEPAPAAEPAAAPAAAEEPAVAASPTPPVAAVEPPVVPAAVSALPEQALPVVEVEAVESAAPEVADAAEPGAAAVDSATSELPVAEPTESPAEAASHEGAVHQPADDENSEAGQ